MDNDRDFILSLVGALDETKTKENVQNALDRISKNVSLKSNSKTAKAITVFDKEQLEKDGIAYLKSVKDIESQLSEMFKGIGTNFSIKKTFADDGSISKFVATIYEGTKAIQTLNFEATKFSDKTFGFRQVGGTATSDKFTTKITSEIELLKSETEQIDLQEVFLTRLNQAKQMLNDGSISSDSLKFGKLNEDIRLLENQIKSIDFSKIGIEGEEHLNAVTDATLKAVEAEHKLYNTTMNKKTGVFNIPALEKEGISFYKNTVGVVEQVKQELEAKGYTPKISILGRDSEGAVTSFTAQIKNASGVIDNLYYDLVKLTDGEKELYGFMSSYGKQIDNTSQEYAKALSDQTKKLSKARTDLDDLMTKFLTGNGNKVLVGDERSNDILNKLTEAETIINRLNSNAGRNTPEEIDGVIKLISQIKKEADEYVNLENKQKRIEDEANKTAKAYENQKYKLEALSQEARKLYDSTFNGKNNLVNEKNITDAQKKLKNLSLFIDGLYTKHNKGDFIPEDALTRFDLKLKETTQDIKNMKDEEALQKALIGNTESQLNALNTIENKVLSIQSKMLDGSKITTPSYITDISNQTVNALNTIDSLRNKAGSITDSESRNLTNIVATLQREADEYARVESYQQKNYVSLEKQKKDLNDLWLQLQNINRTALNPKAANVLGDPEHLRAAREEYGKVVEYVYKLFSQNINGKIIDISSMNEASSLFAKLNQDINVFRQEETLVKNATKSIESQLNTLNTFEQKVKDIRATYLSDSGSNVLKDFANISELETKLTSLEGRINSLRNTTATNNEATYRELTNEYNEANRLAKGYANIEKAQIKQIESIEKQKNQLLDYKRAIEDIANLNLDPSVKGALKNATNISNITETIKGLRSELKVLIDNNNNGLEITTERMNQFGQKYKDLTSQVTQARGQEGLEAMNMKNAQAQINKFAEMERGLDKLKAKYLDFASPSRPQSSYMVDEIEQRYAKLDTILQGFKSNVGNVTDEEINNYKKLETELDLTAQHYLNLESISKKETQTVEDQKYILEAYRLEMEKIRSTSLNPNSALTLTNSDDIKKITDNFTKLEQKYESLRNKNDFGNIINKSELKETDLLLKEIYRDINIISKEDSSKNDFNNSLIKTKANLNLLIGDLERDGKLVGNIRTQITDFVVELSKIKSPEELDNFNARLTAFRTNFIDLQRDERAAFDNENLQQKLQILSSQVNGYINQNTRARVLFKSSFDELQNGIRNASTPQDLVKLQNEFKLLQQNINNAGKAGQTFGERMSGAIKKFMMWTGMTNTVMYLIRSIKQMVTNVKELDNAMVSLKKVTDETDVAYSRIFDEATNKAKELNTSIKNIINSTAEFAKLGFDTEQAQGLAEVANVYANVAEIDVETASKTLVSTINGFKDLTEENAWDIADVINNISNKFAASGADLGDILQRSSAALSEANNDLNESIALGTVAQTINVDASRVGTALKTLSLRIRGATMELEKEGLDTEDMAKTTADLRRYVLAAAGVDILEKDQKTFKSTYQILLEISKVWENIGDLERAALLQKLGGKMQANIVSSILNNGELLEKVYEEAQNSAGSAMQEQNRWAESLEARAGKIEAVFESISSKVFDSDSLKKIFDGLTGILELIDGIISKGKGLNLLGGTIGGILGGSGNGFVNLNTTIGHWNDARKAVATYNKELVLNGVNAAKAYGASIQEINPALSKYLVGLNGARAGTAKFGISMVAAGVKATALKVIITALNAALNALIFAGIGLLISKFVEAANENERLNKILLESSEQIRNNLSDLDDYKKKIDEIVESSKTETEKLTELKDIKEEIHKKYQTEIEDIKDATQARNDLIDAIDKEKQQQLRDYVNNPENQKAYNEAKRRLEDNTVGASVEENYDLFDINNWERNAYVFVEGIKKAYGYVKDYVNGIKKDVTGEFTFLNTDGSDLKISDDISKLFSKSETSKVEGNDAFTFSIDYNGNEEEYFKKLTVLYNKFSDLKTTRVGDLNEDEEKLFQMVNYQYQRLKSENGDFIQSIDDMAKASAQLLTMVTEQGDMSNDDYFAMLSKLASDEYVIEALRELIYETDSFKNSVENTSSAVSEMLSNLQKVSSSCKEISEEIDKADEQFDKLNKTLEDNKDVDKFFSASDIIEILELYPELNDAILETAYGYKIEESAIQELHDTKLAEKKADIQNKLDETQTLLDATTKKLSYYQNELKGIENVAKAKAKLVELEAKYASLGSNTTNPYYNNGALESEIAMLNDFINLSEESERLQKDIDKLSIENKVLGNSFDKAKDATENQTKALNDQKKAIDELKDGYDDAKKAIEDLIELTMAMLKKNAELTKEDLKEQLDGFKKLIDKRKELIDLEKQQYDFEKDLKEQNKDLLKIQQELDALSVEGVSYSLEDLKRKAELEEKVAEQKSKRDDFLYEHQVEVEKDALDKEQELFEDQINTQIKSIEDYLDHEGKIRAEAVDLINGKSQQFYDNLLDYTMNYTKKSRYEFDKLWQDAYDAILKYANGELNVELALINIINAMELAENQLKSIDAALNNIKNSTDDAKKAMYDFLQVTADTKAKLDEINNMPTKSAINYSTDPRFSDPEYAKLLTKQAILGGKNGKNAMDLIKQIRGYHTGGIVEGVSTQHGEVLAKLLSGEVVVTEKQARNFMENTLPKLATNTTTNNQSIAPVINIGDININGNADKDTVSQLNAVRQSIVDDVFKAVNRQNSTFNGMRPRFV